MSDTPRTDSVVKWAYPQGNYVSLRDCRFIERELNLAMSQLEKMDKRIKLFKKCIRLRDTELKKLRSHEYICKKCGIRKNSKKIKADF